jgi:fructose-bisphosphate aldolase, class II
VSEKLGNNDPKPVFLVFHGGSGSEKKDFTEAISYGVVKVNVDTDLQWGYLQGIRDYITVRLRFLRLNLIECLADRPVEEH